MLCEKCQQREATVHITSTVDATEDEKEVAEQKQHFCEQCADAHFASTPRMNSMRGLICLSDSYRSKLYGLLEAHHPEAFYAGEDLALVRRASDVMSAFLRQHLKKDQIEVNEEAFSMLRQDFFCSHHFYTRRDEYERKGSQ